MRTYLYYVFFVVAMSLSSLTGCKADKSEKDKHAEEAQQTIVNNPQTSNVEVIDFYATWCGPCKQLAPILERMMKKYDGRVSFRKVDVDDNPQEAEKYNVTAVPTLVYLIDGEVRDVTIGLLSEDELDAKLADMAGK